MHLAIGHDCIGVIHPCPFVVVGGPAPVFAFRPDQLSGFPCSRLIEKRPLRMGRANVLEEDEFAVLPIGCEGAIGVLGEIGLAIPGRQQVLGLLLRLGGIELQELRSSRSAGPLVLDVAAAGKHLAIFHVGGSGDPRSQGRIDRHQKPARVAHGQGAGLARAVLFVTLTQPPAVRPAFVKGPTGIVQRGAAGHVLERTDKQPVAGPHDLRATGIPEHPGAVVGHLVGRRIAGDLVRLDADFKRRRPIRRLGKHRGDRPPHRQDRDPQYGERCSHDWQSFLKALPSTVCRGSCCRRGLVRERAWSCPIRRVAWSWDNPGWASDRRRSPGGLGCPRWARVGHPAGKRRQPGRIASR